MVKFKIKVYRENGGEWCELEYHDDDGLFHDADGHFDAIPPTSTLYAALAMDKMPAEGWL